MITAKERNTRTHSASEISISAEMFLIENILNKASDSGKFSCDFDHISEKAQAKLERLGYVVRHVQSGHNGYVYKVSWSLV